MFSVILFGSGGLMNILEKIGKKFGKNQHSKKCKNKDFNLAYRGWNCWKIGQGFIFHVIIPVHYTF